MAKETIPEILKKIGEINSFKDRVYALRMAAVNNPVIQKCIKFCYRSDIIWDLPEGTPPYKPLDMPDNWGYNRIPVEARKFTYFTKGNGLKRIKREQMFIEMLESVSPEEAKLLIDIKDGDIKIKNITKKLAIEAFPDSFKKDPEVLKDVQDTKE